MTDNTINDNKTMAGGGKNVALARRYHIIRQPRFVTHASQIEVDTLLCSDKSS